MTQFSAQAGHRWLVLGACLLLFAVALVVRWPNLLLVPQFTDEAEEALWAWRISQGGFWPATHSTSYMGIVFPYSLALLFRLFGPSVLIPRLLVAVCGALTVVVTYLLARRVTSPRAAVVAALVLSFSAVPVLINSHNGYSNSVTPLFVALALLLTHAAIYPPRPQLLPAAGFVWGLALQTHPAVLPLMAGVCIAMLLTPQGRTLLRRHAAWSLFGLACFALGYGNMIAYNLQTDLGTVKLIESRPGYFGTLATASEYPGRARDMAFLFVAMVAGVPDHVWDGGAGALMAAAATGLLVLLLGWSMRDRRALLAWVVVCAVLIMPFFTSRSAFPNGARYLSPILPVVFILIADGFARLWRVSSESKHRARIVGPVAICAVFVCLMAVPAIWLARHYEAAHRSGITNASLLELMDAVADSRPAEPVVVDSLLASRKAEGGGKLDLVARFLLTMHGIPYEDKDMIEIAELVRSGTWPTMLVANPTLSMLDTCFPEVAVSFGLVPYQTAHFDKFGAPDWSLAAVPAAGIAMERRETSMVGDVAALEGYTLTPVDRPDGTEVYLTLFWRPMDRTQAPHHVFVHALDASGRTIAQVDGPPATSAGGTARWHPGTIVQDRQRLRLPRTTAAEQVRFRLGLYDPSSGTRIGARRPDGSWWPEAAIELSQTLILTVAKPETVPPAGDSWKADASPW